MTHEEGTAWKGRFEQLADLGLRMRAAQKNFFKYRCELDKRRAMALERQFDKLVIEQRKEKQSQQQNLF